MHDKLLKVLDKWMEIHDERGSVDVIHLDLAKAFDTVPHQRLLRNCQTMEWMERLCSGLGSF